MQRTLGRLLPTVQGEVWLFDLCGVFGGDIWCFEVVGVFVELVMEVCPPAGCVDCPVFRLLHVS